MTDIISRLLKNIAKKPFPIAVSFIAVASCIGILLAATKAQSSFVPDESTLADGTIASLVKQESFDSSQKSDDGLAADDETDTSKNLNNGDENMIQNQDKNGLISSDGIGTGNGTGIGSGTNGPTIIIGGGTNSGDNGNSGIINTSNNLVHSGDGTNAAYGDDDGDEVSNSLSSNPEIESYLGRRWAYVTPAATTTKSSTADDECMCFALGEVPDAKYATDFLSVKIQLKSPASRVPTPFDGSYIYRNDTSSKPFQGDYIIDWQYNGEDDTTINNTISSEVGTQAAKLYAVNTLSSAQRIQTVEGNTFYYYVVNYKVKLNDFSDENFSFESDKLVQYVTPGDNLVCSFAKEKVNFIKKIQERTDSIFQYKHVYEKDKNGNYSGAAFLGWSSKEDDSAGATTYKMKRVTSTQIKYDDKGDPYYEEELYPVWQGDIKSGLFTIVVKNGKLTLTGYTGSRDAVKSIDVPDGVEVIDLEALGKSLNANETGEFKNLTLINIPASVSEIKMPSDMSSYPNLQGYGVSDKNETFLDVNGVIYNKSGKKLLYVPPAMKSITAWSIKLEEINSNAFVDVSMGEVVLPSTVTTIGSRGFANCKIDTLNIPSASIAIGDDAFKIDASSELSINKLLVPDSTEDQEFIVMLKRMTKLFDSNTALNLVNTVGGLTSTYAINDGLITCDNGAVLASSFADEVSGDVIVPSGTIRIYQEAFKGNNSITSLTLNSELTSIGDSAFESCTGLKSVNVTGTSLTRISDKAFYKCSALDTFAWGSVAATNSIEYIGNYAFAYDSFTGMVQDDNLQTPETPAFTLSEAADVEKFNEYSHCVVYEYKYRQTEADEYSNGFINLKYLGNYVFSYNTAMDGGWVSIPGSLDPISYGNSYTDWNTVVEAYWPFWFNMIDTLVPVGKVNEAGVQPGGGSVPD